MKYKAYQIAPEYQESPLYLGWNFAEFESMKIYGNRYYESRTSQTFDNVRDALYYDNFDSFNVLESDEKKLHELAEKYAHAGHNEEIIAAALRAFEVEYFNEGTEWSIQDENGEEITSVYTYEYNQEKEEIAEALGVNTADIVLYRFDGWTKTEKYKRED